MTLDEFTTKYNGKLIDFDGYYGYQCMDLYRQYVKEVLQVPQSPPVAGARFVWDTYLPDYYERIPNGPTNAPAKGDIIIWGQGVGYYGHIAINSSATSMSIISFDQNWPVNSYCHFQNHNYNYVLGWLHPKVLTAPYSEHQALLDIRATVNSGSSDADKLFLVKQILTKAGV